MEKTKNIQTFAEKMIGLIGAMDQEIGDEILGREKENRQKIGEKSIKTDAKD